VPDKKYGSTLEQTATGYHVSTLLVSHSTMAKQTAESGLVLMLNTNIFHSSLKNTSSGLTVQDTVETLFLVRSVLLFVLQQLSLAKRDGLQNTCLFLSLQILRAKLSLRA
jgi:hypothetical protein